uniref:Uncharacterized protein n=1 Tax=Monopterus albus TaxID=43700 RepID=A0A3Q3IHT8_MONAL
MNPITIFWLIFLSLISPAEAYDVGDGLALLLGTVVTVVGFCACLGWYARKQRKMIVYHILDCAKTGC